MKHLLHGGVIFTLMAFMTAGFFTSCNKTEAEDQPTEKTKLETPVITPGEATDNSLTFSWEAVENAAGYKYELLNTDSDNALAANGTTEETSVTISELLSGTNYTFKLTATAAKDSDFADSDAATATAKTTGKTPLKTPVVTVEATASSLSFSWEAVANANGYAYELLDEEGTSLDKGTLTTEETSKVFEEVDSESNYTFKLTAVAAEDSADYKDSKPAIVEVTTPKAHMGPGEVGGTYTFNCYFYNDDDLLSDIFGDFEMTAKITAYNTYCFENFLNSGHSLTIELKDNVVDEYDDKEIFLSSNYGYYYDYPADEVYEAEQYYFFVDADRYYIPCHPANKTSYLKYFNIYHIYGEGEYAEYYSGWYDDEDYGFGIYLGAYTKLDTASDDEDSLWTTLYIEE